MRERPIFARFYELLSRAEDPMIRDLRAESAGGARGRVLEIGAGNGLNFAHYPQDAVVVAVEPEPTMLRKARPRARDARARVHLVRASAEALPFGDGAFDTIVSTLTLCSVPDGARAAQEARRVLADGGEVRFFEHVRSTNPRVARRQDRLAGPWARVGGGCRPNRDTMATLRRAGFRVRFRSFPLGPRLLPVYPHVAGVARAP